MGFTRGARKSWALDAEAIAENYLVGAVGVEPTTNGLKGRCSTTELRSYKHSSNILHENRLSDTWCAGSIFVASGNHVKWYPKFRNWYLRCFMSETSRILNGPAVGQDHRNFPRKLFLWIALFLTFGIAGSTATEAAEIRSVPFRSAGPGQQFAIADFDGDLRPDLVSVRTEPSGSGTTNYWIQLQLSATGRQSIRVAGPLGGLLIEARDVNGDRAVDLVLSSRWRKEPLAILINDGHGIFLQADPTSFPDAFSKSETELQSSRNQARDAVGVPPQSRAVLFLKTRTLAHLTERADSILFSDAGFPLSSFVISHAERAPPSELRRF
jgi:hypothetical protein